MSDDRSPDGDVAVHDGGTESITESEGEMLERLVEQRTTGDEETAMSEDRREFLLEGVRRMPLLLSLRSGSASASELIESVDMSRSTVHRAINTLKEYDIVEEAAGEYTLTSVGTILANETERFSTHAWTALSLNKFLNSINGHGVSVPIEHFVDATVIRRKPRHPHETIHRIIQLFESSNEVRMFSTVISPVYVDVGYREMKDGTSIEAVFDREVMEIMLSEYPEKAYETITDGNFTVYAHDGLPFELFIFDETIGMAAHNENGNAEILVECDDPAAIEWAEQLYATHLEESDPIRL